MRRTRPRFYQTAPIGGLVCVVAILLVGVAFAGCNSPRQRAGAPPTPAGPPNDSSLFGIAPSDLTRIPPVKQTLIANALATRAVQLETPVPTLAHLNVNDVSPCCAQINTPIAVPEIIPRMILQDAGSSAWYTPRNGWVGYVGGLTIVVYAGATHSYGSPAADVTSIVLVRKWSLSPNLVSESQYAPPTNIGPLHVQSFDANDVLVLQSDDGQSSVFFDPVIGRFLGSPAAAPTPPPNPTSTATAIPGMLRFRVAPPYVPRMHEGQVDVPIVYEGSGYPAFGGFRIHLRWSASVFRFKAADSIWGAFQDAKCAAATTDADGAGAVFSCTGQPELTTDLGFKNNLLTTFVLVPVGNGCSPLQLIPPASLTAATRGTYTIDPNTGEPQVDTYLDATVDGAAHPCTPP